jgi:hypothetical protein
VLAIEAWLKANPGHEHHVHNLPGGGWEHVVASLPPVRAEVARHPDLGVVLRWLERDDDGKLG